MIVQFECNSNIASLLIAFHDIITDKGPDDSIPAQDYFGWIIDELGERAGEYIEYLTNVAGIELSKGLIDLAKSYGARGGAD